MKFNNLACGCIRLDEPKIGRTWCSHHQMWTDVDSITEVQPVTIPEARIHSRKEFDALSEWMDKRKPEPSNFLAPTNFGNIPIIIDQSVPPGKFRIYPDPDSNEYREFDVR